MNFSANTHMYDGTVIIVGRLNGMVSLVTVFEELSNVMSLFWSCDKVNEEIRLFHEQDFWVAKMWWFVPPGEHIKPPFFMIIQTWFPPFCRMDLTFFSLNAYHSNIALSRNSVPTHIVHN